eukprot:s4073_g4.t1
MAVAGYGSAFVPLGPQSREVPAVGRHASRKRGLAATSGIPSYGLRLGMTAIGSLLLLPSRRCHSRSAFRAIRLHHAGVRARGTLSTRARGFSPVQLRAAVTCPPAPVQTLGPVFSVELHGLAREALLERFRAVGQEGVLLFAGGGDPLRHDTDHEDVFRQESTFHYLFGVREPGFMGSLANI